MKFRNAILFIFVSALLLTASLWRHRPNRAPTAADQETIGGDFRSELLGRQDIAHIADGESADIDSPRQPATPKARASQTQRLKASHTPAQPKSGEPVLIKLKLAGHSIPTGAVVLEYQVVEPGKYVALRDAAYQKQWTALPTVERGQREDKSESALEAEVPGDIQKHRRLIRYRFRSVATNKLIAPEETDAQPNFGYFVYDGVPPWKGAINPRARDSKLSQPVTYSSEALQRVPVYHLVAAKAAVEKATWSEADQYGNPSRNSYKYTGTLVYDGVVYDHIGFRARGGAWRHAMGKNMWKFNFLPGHRFEARDDYGIPYKAKWDKLNLGACIQQGDYGMRGEQGMFEALGFRLFNLAGTEAPQTHWIHLRIVNQPDESPSDQYAGDFWGLYLAVENVDEHFLKEHSLPPGNLYKMEFGAKTAFNGNPKITNQSDVKEFARALSRQQASDSWWNQNVDLPRYYNYRSILECIHHYDIDSGKNYFFYLNPETSKWAVVPWDIDLSWGENMYGGGHEPFYRSGLLSRPPFKTQYQERLAEIRDLLFNPEETGKLIDEHAALISDTAGKPSLVDADRAKWDFHPVLASGRSMSGKAGQGEFYFHNLRNTFRDMVRYMKSYVAQRSTWIDRRLLADYRPPEQPKLAAAGALDLSASTVRFQLQPSAGPPPKACQWRLAEITDPKSPAFNPRLPWKYEINALWAQETPGPQPCEIPGKTLIPGHTYRVRARAQDGSDAWSRWSAPIQFTVPGQ